MTGVGFERKKITVHFNAIPSTCIIYYHVSSLPFHSKLFRLKVLCDAVGMFCLLFGVLSS